MQTLHVNVAGGAYPIYIGAGTVASHLPALVARTAQDLVVIVTNETLLRLYPQTLLPALREVPVRVETEVLPDGEPYKTLHTLTAIYDRLMRLHANRKTALIAFGGGVVGDVAGFAAATFMRGLPILQVPTTLLAQVDSSVGGKTAVNHRLGKNAIGAFKQPSGVVIDLDFLRTLPEREVRAGLFELIKHAIIRDRALFDDLEAQAARLVVRPAAGNWAFWEDALHRSVRVKVQVVQEDEREEHIRAILNFGHTLGHLIETHTGYTACLHGEAVGIGMIFAAFASREWGLLPGADFARIQGVLRPLVTPIAVPPLDEEAFAALVLHDKKAAQRAVKFIVLNGLGQAAIREQTTPAELWPLFQRFLAEVPGVLRVSGR
jgi:3-dehydroquinate synthase